MAMDWKQLGRNADKTISEFTEKAQASTKAVLTIDFTKKTGVLVTEFGKKSIVAAQSLNNNEFADKARKTTLRTTKVAREKIAEGQEWAREQFRKKAEPASSANWYLRAAEACESASDAVLREHSGMSTKLSNALAGKLGMAGTTAGIFSIASLVGTAGTGTAIGTLSGAAFTSASLAWIGGSVAMGSIIVGVAAISGGIGLALGAGWVSKKYIWGNKRSVAELEEQEQKVISTCIALAAGFREQSREGRELDAVSAKALYSDALQPLCNELLDIHTKVNDWPYVARNKLNSAYKRLQKISTFASENAKQYPNLTTGTVSAVLIHLIADGDLPTFNESEQLVLEALRRSNSLLVTATEHELANYVKSMEPKQLSGLQNNVKGIYHELRFARDQNANDDQYIVELFEATNHPAADVRIINTTTGDVQEVQLKATNFMSHIRKHNERYETVDVFATSEIADTSDSILSTNISNAELSDDVSIVVSGLDNVAESYEVLNSMALAGMVTLARNTRVLLMDRKLTEEDKGRLLENGAVSAGAAGIISLLLG